MSWETHRWTALEQLLHVMHSHGFAFDCACMCLLPFLHSAPALGLMQGLGLIWRIQSGVCSVSKVH